MGTDPVAEAYASVGADIDEAAFREQVTERATALGVGEALAAATVAAGHRPDGVATVAEIPPTAERVAFGALVREPTERPGPGDGVVASFLAADETGTVRVVADGVELDDLSAGAAVRVTGTPKETYAGIEVAAAEVKQLDADPDDGALPPPETAPPEEEETGGDDGDGPAGTYDDPTGEYDSLAVVEAMTAVAVPMAAVLGSVAVVVVGIPLQFLLPGVINSDAGAAAVGALVWLPVSQLLFLVADKGARWVPAGAERSPRVVVGPTLLLAPWLAVTALSGGSQWYLTVLAAVGACSLVARTAVVALRAPTRELSTGAARTLVWAVTTPVAVGFLYWGATVAGDTPGDAIELVGVAVPPSPALALAVPVVCSLLYLGGQAAASGQ